MGKQYIAIAMFIIFSVVTIALTGPINFPYVLFYFCIELAIYTGLKAMLKFPEQYEEMLKEKVEINNCLHQNDENK